jgi:phosphoribosylglycinamide formyltransferase 2
MFITKEEVIFSELSPRPHDTGMVTLVSQNFTEFDLHARAVLGLPIPAIEAYGPSASHVVLADRNSQSIAYDGVEEAMRTPGVDVRVFGKPSSRPYRRMAVCLARGDTLDEARAKALKASETVRIVYE